MIKATYHTYWFDVSKSDQAQAYEKLCTELKDGRKIFNVLADSRPRKSEKTLKNGQEIELETNWITDNQWNTKCGFRVFDWYEGIYPNKNIKSGHYLTITPEMKELRKTTFKCGYCGAHYHDHSGDKFCGKCIGSEYLEEKDFPLLRLMPASFTGTRQALTDDECTLLLERYIEAQTKFVHTPALAKLRKECDAKIECINEEYAGFEWLANNHIKSDNVIYYSHSRTFTFGWRKHIGEELRQIITEKMKGFPYQWEFKDA